MLDFVHRKKTCINLIRTYLTGYGIGGSFPVTCQHDDFLNAFTTEIGDG